MDVQFLVLGPVRALLDGRELDLPRRQVRLFLGFLLLEPNQPLSADRLAQLLTADRRVSDPRAAVQTAAARLRGCLAPAGSAVRLVREGQSYTLLAQPEQIDAHRFRTLAEQARHGGLPAERARLGRAALALWRDEPLADVASEELRRRVGGPLIEIHRQILELCVAADLRLGRHEQVVVELTRLTESQPLNEQLVKLLMLALYRCGRRADALDTYRRYRTAMNQELGLDPAPELRDLEIAIIREDPDLAFPAHPSGVVRAGPAPDRPAEQRADQVVERTDPPETRATATEPPASCPAHPQPDSAGQPVPAFVRRAVRMLPAELQDFVGRERETAELLSKLSTGSGVRTAVVTGMPGIGKTSLTVRLAHQMSGHYPDTQLYLRLRENDRPLSPEDALKRLLLALGVPSQQIPADLSQRSAMFRAEVATGGCLLVLDDASDAAQIRPLLPGMDSIVLVTSRHALVGIDGALQVRLPPLTVAEAVRLLAGVIGADRVEGDRASAATLARQCGLLPLAVRLFAARLAGRPHLALRESSEQLASSVRRLDHLQHAERNVRAVLISGYQEIDPAARRLLRRMGLLNLETFPYWLLPLLLEADEEAVDQAVATLVEASLVDSGGTDEVGQFRYRLHNLVRHFARERVEEEETPADRARVLGNVFAAWLTLVEEARSLLDDERTRRFFQITPELPRPPRATVAHQADPYTWCSIEAPGILAAIQQAADTPGCEPYSWALAWNYDYFLHLDSRLDALVRSGEIGLAAAERHGDPTDIAAMRLCIAFGFLMNDDLPSAKRHVESAIAAGGTDTWLQAEIHGVAHQIHYQLGDPAAQRASLHRAIALYESTGDHGSAGLKTTLLGKLELLADEPSAGDTLARGISLLRTTRATRQLAQGLRELALWQRRRGDTVAAVGTLMESLALVERQRDVVGEVCVLSELSMALADCGWWAKAADVATSALERADLANSPSYRAYAEYAEARIRLGRDGTEEARREIEALVPRMLGRPHWQLAALTDLATAYEVVARDGTGDPAVAAARAREHWLSAARMAERIGDRAAGSQASLRLARSSTRPRHPRDAVRTHLYLRPDRVGDRHPGKHPRRASVRPDPGGH